MHIGIEGTAPGVEWEKELSLSVEERSSPESHEAWVDADCPQPVTYVRAQILMLIFVSEKKQAEVEMVVKEEEVMEEREIEKVIFPTTWIRIFNVKLKGQSFIILHTVCCCYVMWHKVRSTYLGSKTSFQWLKYTPQGLYF